MTNLSSAGTNVCNKACCSSEKGSTRSSAIVKVPVLVGTQR